MFSKRLKLIIFLVACCAMPAFADGEVPSALLQMGDGTYFSTTAIVVDKSKRLLTIWEVQGGGVVKRAEYPSDLGKLDGPKIARGDKRTPEGVYFLEKQLDGATLDFSQYGVRAFTTNYPNLFDQRDGKTGDGIWLHAIPDTVSLDRGSRGCVVVRNEAILEISKSIKLGQTPIVISDSIQYLPASQVQSRASAIEKTIEDWRRAWESKNIDSYISFYGDEFESQKMDRNAWRKFKEGLNGKYQSISVSFSKPAVFEHKSRVIVRVLQKYKSDKHEDFGEKWVYLTEKNGSFKIVAEEWAPVENAEALQAVIVRPSTASPN